jgi:carboxyl-terminal processing protease
VKVGAVKVGAVTPGPKRPGIRRLGGLRSRVPRLDRLNSGWGLAAVLVALLVAIPLAKAAPGVITGHGRLFDPDLKSRVFGAALAFTAPRILDPATPAELSLWGLGGITALDPSLAAERRGNVVQLDQGGHVLLSRPCPATGDSAGWGRLAAEMNEAAMEASPGLRRAGAAALTQSFFDEMFNHLDPYSRYVPPEPAEEERDKLSLDATAGLGLVRNHGAVAVSDVVPGGPGEDAGFRVGDRIVSVDGRPVRGLAPERVQALLTGEENTDVRVVVRGLDSKTRDLTVTLAYVPPETVSVARDGNLMVLKVTAFDGNTAERLSQAIEAGLIAGPPPAAVVIDLRGNRGGLLRQAVTSVALLAEQGVIASTAGRDPQATHDWRIDGGGDLTQGAKLVVLVDGRTASAAEIMAAALADLGRGVVIGSSTLGKGLVQTITRLPDGGELFVTWSRVLAPKDWPIQALGVMPQICTSRGEDETNTQLSDLNNGKWDMAKAVAQTRAARAPLPVAQALELREPCPAAEASDEDLVAAHYLADHPEAYASALLGH